MDAKMSYKIIKDDKKFYQVMHPDGSKFTVPKHGLSKDLQDKINGLPKHYDGGVVGINPNAPIPESLAKEEYSMVDPGPAPFLMGKDIPVPTEHFVEGQGVVPISQPTSQAQQQQIQPQVDQGFEQPFVQTTVEQQPVSNDGVVSALDNMGAVSRSGVAGLKKAESELAQNLVDNQAKQQQVAQDFARYAEENSNAGEAIAKEKLDRGRLWGSMNTGNKVLAAISVALSGIGSGLTGRPNAALDIINKSIDQDIELQKENKNSLLNANMKQFKNKELAYTATRMGLLNEAENIAKKYAAAAKTAEAEQSANNFLAQINLQKEMHKKQAMQQMGGQFLLQKATEGDLAPEQIVSLPKEYRELYIPGAGFATNPEGAKKVREVKANRDDVTTSIDRLMEIRRLAGREGIPGPLKAEAQALGQVVIGKLREPVVGPGSMQEGEYQRLQQVVPKDVTEIMSLDDNVLARLSTAKQIIENNYDNKLKAEGLNPKPRPKPISGMGLTLNK